MAVARARMMLALRLALAALVLHLVLVLPSHPGALTPGALLLLPLELPLLLALLVAGRGARWLRGLIVAVLMLSVALRLADLAMVTAFARPFNPVGDLPLAAAALNLAQGSLGTPMTVLAVLAALGALIVLAVLLWRATGGWGRLRPRSRLLPVALTAALALLVVAQTGAAMGRWRLPADPPGTAFATRHLTERLVLVDRTLQDLREFRAAAARDPFAGAPDLLQALDRDLLVIFIESYGRASLDGPLYADTTRATLQGAQTRLADLGLAMASGWLASPTQGGQSWLAHATFANGLWVNDQSRYAAVLASGRQTLFHHAGRSGFPTAAVMPQITLDWPESAVMGFDTILAAQDLGYRGAPFNWVTMPDQYTLSAMDRLLLDPSRDRPAVVQVALVSSHAPWVPVPDPLPWEEVGDGSLFTPMALAGDPPEVVWRDHDRVREQYRKAVAYSLRTVLDYAARHAGDAPLMIVLGDHQAAGFVAQDSRPDVPVHVIGPPGLVARLAAQGLTQGLIPAADAPVRPMDQMRDLILSSLTDPAP
ncbi:MAG: sulfatase-like hydrolase/transferase [Salipiger marinus]|uniref:sulfatase-like hydrolase/transferase n=1 Tax=Salipiger marinus TaxID=555512 RepID=UPI0040591AFB